MTRMLLIFLLEKKFTKKIRAFDLAFTWRAAVSIAWSTIIRHFAFRFVLIDYVFQFAAYLKRIYFKRRLNEDNGEEDVHGMAQGLNGSPSVSSDDVPSSKRQRKSLEAFPSLKNDTMLRAARGGTDRVRARVDDEASWALPAGV